MAYRQRPYIAVQNAEGAARRGWQAVCETLRGAVDALPGGRRVLTCEVYPGADEQELLEALRGGLKPALVLLAREAALPNEQVQRLIERNLTDDRVFGVMDHSRMEDYFDRAKIQVMRAALAKTQGLVLILGTGASLIERGDLLVYADMARWEIQNRWRRGEACNWLADNFSEEQLKKYKRGFFFEWRVADRRKQEIFSEFDYLLDANRRQDPSLVTGDALREALRQAARQPFSMVPYFDPGVWGGQWMKEKLGLDASAANYAWSFNGVPEENSLCMRFGEVEVEIPAIDLVFFQPLQLLGDKVHARFGAEFPIRFDFLDTVGGQSLSLQVHPLTEYVQDRFGMHYTQDESYYILDCTDEACVYLGVKTGVNPEAMLDDLRRAERGEADFPDERHVNRFPVQKHDHVLIPAGTVHCSGPGAMVLEISATPYIFTFKLWDWGRVGMDGRPRPVHIDHGSRVIQWHRDTEWVQRELLSRVEPVGSGSGWREERTGLHEREFIETRRLWFTEPVRQNTDGGVQMLMVVEGEGCVVTSPENCFEPFTARYAECFIIPAAVGSYQVAPLNGGQQTGLIRAYVRT